ncbi:rRNA 2'-O-methyltransferase fibrillarin 1-like [Malus domestica]|uniref:rRNA 2'-O-methyltransferase fibrillarin 1-like n=1 Tax=Malus domestica TaxID=3750 RepID=UPI0039764B27
MIIHMFYGFLIEYNRGNIGVARVAHCGSGNHGVHRGPASPPSVHRGQAPGIRRGPDNPRGLRRGPAPGDRIRPGELSPICKGFRRSFAPLVAAAVAEPSIETAPGYEWLRLGVERLALKGFKESSQQLIVFFSSTDAACKAMNVDGTRVEYRVWNPFRSKLGAAILAGIDYHWDCEFLHLGQYYRHVEQILLYLIVLEVVYAVEVSPRGGRDLVNMAKKRTNVIPIIVHARHPARYWMLVSLVDVIFADVAQPDQARILGLNANYFLKVGGCCLISIKANCIDSTLPAEKVYEHEMERMGAEQLTPKQRVTHEPFERDHACVVGGYRMPIKIENELSESWCMHACLQKIVSLLRFSSARILL